MINQMTDAEFIQCKEESIAQAYERFENEYYAQNAEPNFPWKLINDDITDQRIKSIFSNLKNDFF